MKYSRSAFSLLSRHEIAAILTAAQQAPMTVHLISSGESSGELDNMLERAATNQERELDSMMGAIVGLLGPLLIVVMGLFVMGIVFAMLMPIFQMNDLIR